jgi:hypothetical protein
MLAIAFMPTGFSQNLEKAYMLAESLHYASWCGNRPAELQDSEMALFRPHRFRRHGILDHNSEFTLRQLMHGISDQLY